MNRNHHSTDMSNDPEESPSLEDFFAKFKVELEKRGGKGCRFLDAEVELIDGEKRLVFDTETDSYMKGGYSLPTIDVSMIPLTVESAEDKNLPILIVGGGWSAGRHELLRQAAALHTNRELLFVSLENPEFESMLNGANELRRTREHGYSLDEMAMTIPKMLAEPPEKEPKHVDDTPWYAKGKRSKKDRRLHR